MTGLNQMDVKKYEMMQNIRIGSVSVLIQLVALSFFFAGCAKDSDSFSLLSEGETFLQNTNYTPRPVDILWVVDNSGSMQTSQNNVSSNFGSFINKFQTKGYDFHMAVGATDAFLAKHYNDNNRAKFKTGSGGINTGYPIMDSSTPNLTDVFTKNVKVGISGSGDERPLESMRVLLDNPLNSSFRRPGAYLAIIIVTDEEDHSHYDWFNGVSSYFMAADASDWRLSDPVRSPIPGLTTIATYKGHLDNLTGGNDMMANYSVNTIGIQDSACRSQLIVDGNTEREITARVNDLATATAGQKLSLCGNFGDQLTLLTDTILTQASSFRLNREPVVASIVVRVNGSIVPQDSVNGWTYVAPTNSIEFHGTAIPPANAVINVVFDPATVKI